MAEIEYVDAENDGEAVIDLESAAPRGVPCETCGTPVEPSDRFCPGCAAPNPAVQFNETVEVVQEQKHFRCEGCGSEVATDPEQRSYVCPFCDSTYVVEFSPEQSGRQKPEFVIGFAVTVDQAREKYQQWLQSNSWFRPGDLKNASVVDKMKGIYLPFWSFSMLAESSWNARIGEYWYRTETYTTTENGKTVTKTRQVRETEWWNLSGNHHRYHAGYMVSGSKGLAQKDADRIKPFQLPALKRYEPYYLAGWLSEEYTISLEAALESSKQEFYDRERGEVTSFMPGDTHRDLRVSTNFSNINSDLCLLPIYLLSYRHKDKLFRFMVNGQTGKVAGDKPLSWLKIGIFSTGVLLVVLLVILLIALLVG
jgi:Zn finger protein HypA/HybF involved in hydrogenase expression